MIRYVGKSTRGLVRPLEHMIKTIRAKTHCGYWLRQLQKAGLTYEVVVLEEPPEHELDDCERRWITYGRLSGWRLTNKTDGGDGAARGEANVAKRPEVRAKLKAAQAKRLPISEATRQKMQRAARERPRLPHTEETKAKIRQSNLGKVVSEETKAKQSAAHTGFKHSDEAKSKMSVWRTGDNNVSKRPEVRQKISESHKSNPKVLANLAAIHARKRIKDVQCGTRLGYARGDQARRKGEPSCGPCAACKEAAATYARERRKQYV